MSIQNGACRAFGALRYDNVRLQDPEASLSRIAGEYRGLPTSAITGLSPLLSEWLLGTEDAAF